MTVSTGSYLKGYHDKTRSMGRKAINSDFTIEIEGFEHVYLLTKQCPWPELSSAGEIAVATPLGAEVWQAQQAKVNQQGQVTFYETVAGDIDQLMADMLARGDHFNAKIYEGTPTKYIRYKRIEDCFLQIDPTDRDWENRSQVLTFSGTMFYHYYGEIVEGNSKDYR